MRELFKVAYKEKPIYFKRDHILIRCPFCGDSIKNFNHAHLYIEPEKGLFWCARCYTGGTIKYLLYYIKDRLSDNYFPDLLKYYNKFNYYNNTDALDSNINNVSNYKYKLVKNSQKDNEIIQNWFLNNFNIYLEDLNILPIFLGYKIGLPKYICWLTISDLVFCRNLFKPRQFKTVKLTDNTFNRCSIFSFKKHKLSKFNNINNQIQLVIAEGLTDLFSYYNNNKTNINRNNDNILFISTNGKYKDDLKFIIDKLYTHIKNIDAIFLIDKDAIKQEINFIKSISNLNNKVIILPTDGSDYRTSTNFEIYSIKAT